MSEMTNKTIAVVANEKNEMHKSIFDDELFDDVTSYDSNDFIWISPRAISISPLHVSPHLHS